MSSGICGTGCFPTIGGDVVAPGHRAKRIKTDNPRVTEAIISRLESDGRTLAKRVRASENIDAGVAAAETEDVDPPRHIRPKDFGSLKTSRTSANNLQQITKSKTQDLTQAKDSIDFSTAPSDPVDLSLWVAQQIGKFETENAVDINLESGRDDSRRSLLSHPPAPHSRQRNDEIDAAAIAERDERRDGDRKRKQSWRSSHHERNKDNDLRCRVNARAKELYGSRRSLEKTEWAEAELSKRRENRERRKTRETYFPISTFDPKLAAKIFFKQDTICSSETSAAGLLLFNTLQVVHSDGEKDSNSEAAAALKSALDNMQNPTPFIDALRILGESPEIMRAIQTTMNDYMDSAQVDAESVSISSTHVSVGDREHVSKNSDSDHTPVPASGDQSRIVHSFNIDPPNTDIIEALEEATNILNNIAEGNSETYVTPYANPCISRDQNGITGPPMQVINHFSESKEAGVEASLDTSDIDNFLRLAAGGSVSEEDDDGLSDAPDSVSPAGEQTTAAQPDDDVSAIFQRVINELVTGRTGPPYPFHVDHRHSVLPNGSRNSFYGSPAAKDQAANLQKLFERASVSINTVIPAAQSRAISNLYGHLSSRAHRFPTYGGSIQPGPGYTSVYGRPRPPPTPPRILPVMPRHILPTQLFIPPPQSGQVLPRR